MISSTSRCCNSFSSPCVCAGGARDRHSETHRASPRLKAARRLRKQEIPVSTFVRLWANLIITFTAWLFKWASRRINVQSLAVSGETQPSSWDAVSTNMSENQTNLHYYILCLRTKREENSDVRGWKTTLIRFKNQDPELHSAAVWALGFYEGMRCFIAPPPHFNPPPATVQL